MQGRRCAFDHPVAPEWLSLPLVEKTVGRPDRITLHIQTTNFRMRNGDRRKLPAAPEHGVAVPQFRILRAIEARYRTEKDHSFFFGRPPRGETPPGCGCM